MSYNLIRKPQVFIQLQAGKIRRSIVPFSTYAYLGVDLKLILYFMSHVVFNVFLSEGAEKIHDGDNIDVADLMQLIENFLSELEDLMCIAADRYTMVCNELKIFDLQLIQILIHHDMFVLMK